MELKVTEEKILEAAKQCSSAERVLRAMFPEAFEGELFEFLNEDKANKKFILSYTSNPLFIANDISKTDYDRGKVLLMDQEYYEVKVIRDYVPGYTGFKFIVKKQ